MGKEYSALIIDDEKPARDLIRTFLKRYEQIRVIGEADNGFEGCLLINENKPDLVFLDVQMPKLSGIELLDLIDNPKPFIIFSTAYDEYAVQAFERNAIDYLLKPYNRERFNLAIDKFFSGPLRNLDYPQPEILPEMEGIRKPLQRIPVRSGSKILIIKVEDIRYIVAEDDYVKIVSTPGNYVKQVTMSYLERALPEDIFVRIHRSYLLNINYLKQLEIYDKTGYTASLTDGSRLPVSRTGGKKLMKLINLD